MARNLGLAASLLTAILFLSFATATHAADPAIKCQASKLKEAGKYNFCRVKAEAKAAQKIEPSDYSKCDTKFNEKWDKIETKGGCTTSGDRSEIASKEYSNTDAVTADLSGQRFYDHGLAVTDTQTDLMWIKTIQCGDGIPENCTGAANSCTTPNCFEHRYNWSTSGEDPDGLAFTKYLAQLNGNLTPANILPGGNGNPSCFYGHCDWRLPTVEELLTIVDCAFAPCIAPVFGPTAATSHWSSTTFPPNPSAAKNVGFGGGIASESLKVNNAHLRAVRRGL